MSRRIRPAAAIAPLLPLALVLAVLLASARLAGATACLSEPATLDDQRALDAWRVATAAACPCDGVADHVTYRRCARDVAAERVAGGALRRECLRTARAIARGGVCGTAQVACGRVRQSDQSAGCARRMAAACIDDRRFAQRACAQTHCADVVEWTAGTCLDPRQPGPFAPGFRSVTYTKDSAASPGTPRLLATSIWYPAPAGSGPISSSTGGVDGAPLDPSGGPYPLVLFSHGSCGYPQQSKFLTPLLASHGFVVVAPPHPGNTIAEIPNCNTPAAIAAAIVERPQDVVFVLDQILAANQDPASPFHGAIDAARVAMTGHSFGGLTTYLVTAIEPRIDVAVALAPAALAASTLPVPSLTMLGSIDSVISNPNARAAYARSAAPKLLVEIAHSGHYSFSDFCFPGSDCNPPATLTSDEAHAAALRFVLPFLKVHLAGDPAWAPLLGPPARAGFVYAAE